MTRSCDTSVAYMRFDQKEAWQIADEAQVVKCYFAVLCCSSRVASLANAQ